MADSILRRRDAEDHFQLSRRTPAADLAPYAAHFWIVAWDLRGRDAHRQRVLTHPSVNVTFTTGGRARVAGVMRGVFAETIEGLGRVVGVRFRPGGFRPFLDGPVSALTGRFTPVEDLFGPESRGLADAIIAAPDDEAVDLLAGFLRERTPVRLDPLVAEVTAIVDHVAADPALSRVADLAATVGVGPRRLQRIFAEYVGVGPKWVIRRCRMQEAADRAASGADIGWAALAADLGYADQAHFTRDFSATIGTSPAQYAQDCAAVQAAPTRT